jgi:hypothetical protein
MYFLPFFSLERKEPKVQERKMYGLSFLALIKLYYYCGFNNRAIISILKNYNIFAFNNSSCKKHLRTVRYAAGNIPMVAKHYRRKEADAVLLQEARPYGLERKK